jgi:carboxypeptidase Taq
MTTKLEQLKAKLAEVTDLGAVGSLMGWDQQTYMPPGGSAARARQSGTMAKLVHEMRTSAALGDLLKAAEDENSGLDYDDDDAAYLRMARRDYDQQTKVPADLMAEFARTTAEAHEVWAKARQQNDFPAFAPMLEKIVGLVMRIADHLGYDEHRYDAMLDMFEPGMKMAEVRAIFDDLKVELVPLVQQVLERTDTVTDEMLHGDFDPAAQREFGEMIARALGYDFERGRQDEAVHPFTTSFSRDDVRITTRFDPAWLSPALFATIHEAGHAMYEQGYPERFEGNILCAHASLGLHESQSRLWENVVGRSRGFWKHYYPRLQQTFPDQFAIVDLDAFYRAINKVSASFIRVESDELTYNLHIMVRFEIELALLSGDLKVADAAAAWNDKFEEMLGVRPPDDANGILQDVHWSGGSIGYFPTYSLGNLLSAQLYEKAVEAHPEIPAQTEQGEFGALLGWMREHIHAQARKYLPAELVERATGEPIQTRSYMKYLKAKYGEIYEL